jgi:hypothetical protein
MQKSFFCITSTASSNESVGERGYFAKMLSLLFILKPPNYVKS